MTNQLTFSQNGVKTLEGFEGFKGTAYQDIAGNWTIGYGVRISGPEQYPNGISEADAETLLLQHAQPCVDALNSLVTVQLNQNQFDALVCFTYNVGINAFSNSTMLHMINYGLPQQAADQFPCWSHAGGQFSQGLMNRRMAERALFLS